MKKHLQLVKSAIIIAFVLGNCCLVIPFQNDPVTAQRPKILSFSSYIDITYDPAPLNENLVIDESINVPLEVIYWTDVPEDFLQFIPFWQIRNIILYGSMIGPMQKIHIDIIDKPDWANIYITQPDILIDIPSGGQQNAVKVTTSLILSPRTEAPSQSYTIGLNVQCDRIGRINEFSYQESLDFTPSFIPTVQITPENPTRTVGPRESINFKITVKNEANKKARISPQIKNVDPKWTPTINPPFYDIDAGDQADFIFSIYSPYDFGWHNEIQSFQIDFTTQIFPLRSDAPVGGPYSIYLRVNNYGFSLPGFEFGILIIALLVAVFILKKMRTQ